MMPRPEIDSALIGEYLNGAANESMLMVNLMAQVIGILIVGIILWRLSAVFQRKRTKTRKTAFSDSRFQKHWKR